MGVRWPLNVSVARFGFQGGQPLMRLCQELRCHRPRQATTMASCACNGCQTALKVERGDCCHMAGFNGLNAGEPRVQPDALLPQDLTKHSLGALVHDVAFSCS